VKNEFKSFIIEISTLLNKPLGKTDTKVDVHKISYEQNLDDTEIINE